MRLTMPTVRALAWFWGSIAVAGGAGAAAIQLMGPPLPPAGIPTSTPELAQTAMGTGSTSVVAPTSLPLKSPPRQATKTASTISNPRGGVELPALRSSKAHKVELADARRGVSHRGRHSASVVAVTEHPRWQAQWAEQHGPYWNDPTTRYAVARLPRYAYPNSPYYGFYGGY
jgi:hypothetical protein